MVAVSAAVFLVAVPTGFQLFSAETGKWALWPRIGIGVIWLLVAVAVFLNSVRREQEAEAEAQYRRRRRSARTREALEAILVEVLAPGRTGLPDHYTFTVYVFDGTRLSPLFPVEPQDAFELRCFEPGKGATGIAFERGCENGKAEGTTVAVTGDAVSDASRGLTPGQQQFFRTYRSVVASPVWISDVRPSGALTAISRVDDGCFRRKANRAILRRLSDVVGEVLYATINPDEWGEETDG